VKDNDDDDDDGCDNQTDSSARNLHLADQKQTECMSVETSKGHFLKTSKLNCRNCNAV